MNTTSKKWFGLIAAVVLACSIVGIAGCSSQTASSSSASGSSASSSASESQASASGDSSSSGAASSSTAAIANPWSSAANAEEAAKGAGLEAFPLPEGEIADLGAPFAITYQYMNGMAEARYEFPASAVTVRTSTPESMENADISGDYNEYAHEWTAEVAGMSVACAGNREGESTKTYWTGDDGLYHSLVAEGLGGDMDFGLTADRLAVFVEAMK